MPAEIAEHLFVRILVLHARDAQRRLRDQIGIYLVPIVVKILGLVV